MADDGTERSIIRSPGPCVDFNLERTRSTNNVGAVKKIRRSVAARTSHLHYHCHTTETSRLLQCPRRPSPAAAMMAAKPVVELDHELADTPGEATILVSEFPPPPPYFRCVDLAALAPPAIPQDALTRGTRRAAAVARRLRAEAEQLRLGRDATDAILGGVAKEEDDDGAVVAVFGEIVEDPLVVEPLDPCEDPTVIRDQVKSLNIEVVQGFIKLVQDLVHRPAENK